MEFSLKRDVTFDSFEKDYYFEVINTWAKGK